MTDRAVEVGDVERQLDGWIAVDRLCLRHARFDGTSTPWLERTVVRRGAAVVVLPYDPIADTVALIEQFRAGAVTDPLTSWLVEAPAGLHDQDDDPEATGRRELEEETGLVARAMVPVYAGYASPGFTDEYLYGFVAHTPALAVAGHHGLGHEHEDIRPFVLPFAEAMAWWREGRIRNLPTVAVLLALAAERDRLRREWG